MTDFKNLVSYCWHSSSEISNICNDVLLSTEFTFFYFFLFCCGSFSWCLYASGLLKGFPRIYVKLDNKIHYEIQCLRAVHLRILSFLPKHSFCSSNHLLFIKDKQKTWLCLFIYLGESFLKDWTRQSRHWYTASNLLGILLSR